MHTRLVDVPGAERQAQTPEAAWHTLSAEEVLRAEETHQRHGLSSAEAASRADRFGPNTLAEGKAEPRWRAFIRQYSDPMQVVLLAAGLLSLYPLNQLGTGFLLILLTLANAVLGLQQEGEAESAVAALQRRLIVTARVRRDGQEAEIPAEQLVPGDVVSIEAGDVVPADGRLLRAATLEVAESELTGESLPVSKGTAPVGEADMPLGDRTDMVYMNTSVTRGTGEFVVTATGMATEVGHISGMLQAQPTVKTPLTRQLDHLSKQLLLVAGVALIASMAVNLSHGHTFNAVFNAAVAFAIAAVPVQLPMVVTTILAWGTRAMVRVGAIMKQLPSTETLGSTSAINTDKTGTLTLNQMTAVQMVVAGHRYAVDGKGYSTHGRINRGYSRPVEGLMERRPRPPGQPILTGGVLIWLVSVGLVMAIGTLSVVSWAEQAHTLATARTMGVVVFSLFNLFFSIESRHRRESVFSLSTFAGRASIVTTGASIFLLVMATVLAPCQAILKTTALDVNQWLLGAAVALSIIAVTEIRKAFLRQTVGPVRLRRSPRRRLRHKGQ